jgi:alkanesulfonate monooxygenase SsuD/methylene tetrahydromethanopterin reductase-like flavin-dependent oxidoreductase (luciferase family)
MEFCLMTEPQLGGTYEDQLKAARWCEERGLAGFARSDHYFWSHDDPAEATDAFASLAGLARETEHIRLAVLVTPVTFRHPAVITKNAATIDQMSGGRFDLGVGTGWNELEHGAFGLPFPERGERFDRLVETLGYLGAAFADGRSTFEGSHYRLDGDIRPKPTGLGIIVGGSGPKRTPTLAGRYATEYNSFLGSATEAAPKIAVMREAAERAGRDPDDIRISMMGQVFGGSDDAEYQHLMRRAAEERDLTVAELVERFDEGGVPHGTPDRLGETFSELTQVGVTRVYLQHLDLSDLSPLEPLWAAVSAAISQPTP